MEGTGKSIVRFMAKAMLAAAPVLLLSVAFYVVADPFKVLRKYDTYFPDSVSEPARVSVNKGMVTLCNYEQRLAEGHRYNAFIFGSSISCYYDAQAWEHRLGSGKPVSAIHFDSSAESLESMALKVDYLYERNTPVDFALVVLDPLVMENEPSDEPFCIDPPQIRKGWLHFLTYHYTFFRSTLNADFFKSWIPSRILGRPVHNSRHRVFSSQPIVYDPLHNQETLPQWDALIASDPEGFYAARPLIPSPQGLTEGTAVLKGGKLKALEKIAHAFSALHTDYQIVVSPNRGKVTLNPQDHAALCRIFGSQRVHDFTSTLARRLETDTLLYDNTHYRPVFATELMDSVYAGTGCGAD